MRVCEQNSKSSRSSSYSGGSRRCRRRSSSSSSSSRAGGLVSRVSASGGLYMNYNSRPLRVATFIEACTCSCYIDPNTTPKQPYELCQKTAQGHGEIRIGVVAAAAAAAAAAEPEDL